MENKMFWNFKSNSSVYFCIQIYR